MKHKLTEFVIVRPKKTTSMHYFIFQMSDGAEALTDYTKCSIINYKHGESYLTLEEDMDLTQYVFCGTRNERDEYCHPDDFKTYVEINVKDTIKNLTNKLNLI